MQAGTEASRCSEGSGRKSTSSRRMMLGLSGRPDGMARCPNEWNSGQMSVWTGWHVVRTVDREPTFLIAESSETLLNSGIPCKASLHTSDFVQTEWGQSQTNKLPIWSFWDKNHLTGLEIHSRSKNKNYSLFLSQKGQRVKQSNKKHTAIKITPPNCLRRTRVNRVI